MVYFPLAIVLWTHGRAFLTKWVGPEFAGYSAPVLPILLGGNLIAVVGQFNSSMLLFGLARHSSYARGMIAEAALGIAALAMVIPRYGIVGAAWVVAGFMTVNRGLLSPWLVCREINVGFLEFTQAVYMRPTLTALPVFGLCWWLRSAGLPGETWWQLIAVGVIAAVTYYPLAFFTSVPVEQRAILTGRIAGLFQRRSRQAS
jgi:O-antigen/teichoic acid export membrane protein